MKTKNSDANCGNCPYASVWWKADEDGPDFYINASCERFPPSAMDDRPLITDSQICGEHPNFFKDWDNSGETDKTASNPEQHPTKEKYSSKRAKNAKRIANSMWDRLMVKEKGFFTLSNDKENFSIHHLQENLETALRVARTFTED